MLIYVNKNLHKCSEDENARDILYALLRVLSLLVEIPLKDPQVVGTDSRSDCFLSDFPSPSYKSSCWSHDFQSSTSSVSTPSEEQTEISSGCDFSSEHASEAEVLEDLTTTDEPLFWPFEQKTDWNSEETWNYFSISPRKGIGILASGTPPDSIPSKHHDRNMDVEEGRGVRLVFRISSIEDYEIEAKIQGTRKWKVHVSEPVGVVNECIEVDIASKEVPIEMFMGLAEFDGHEGVDSEFNEDDFSLHASLC
ncbi:hypothetical protein ACFX13_032587 [Malus domestica]